MSFNNLPQIDINAKNSEKSELKFKEFFSQHNNFISRTDVPDKGCDFDVELIQNHTQSSNWRFPVQLKSVQTLQMVENDTFISFPFETSRLNYLMQRPGSTGLLVLYSIEQDCLFYELADKIYERLLTERESEEWKKNEKVSIRIPVENVITNSAVKTIHDILTKRFVGAIQMQKFHGQKYDLPTTDLKGEFKYDFTDVSHIKKFLSEYGPLLLDNYDLRVLYGMLAKLPFDEIISSKELLLMGAIVYSEAAKYSESIFFGNKLKNKFELNESESAALKFCTLKTNMMLGYISQADFVTSLKDLANDNIGIENAITIRINLLRYQLLEIKPFHNLPENLSTDIESIFSDIEKLEDGNRRKDVLVVWNCENYSILLNHNLRMELAKSSLAKALGNDLTLEEKRLMITSFLKEDTRLHTMLNNLYKKGISKNDKLLQANALSTYVVYFLQKQLNLMSNDKSLDIKTTTAKQLDTFIGFSMKAYSLFLELNMLKEAYYNLCNALEMAILVKELFKQDVEKDIQVLQEGKEAMESTLEITKYDLSIPAFLEKIRENNEQQKRDDFTKVDDEQLENLARIYIGTERLPEDRFQNVLNDLKANRLFKLRCTNSDIVLLYVLSKPAPFKNDYKFPCVYVLKSTTSGIESQHSSDISSLLTSWGF